ncbi:MAG: DUF6259 domain-containing protein [Planctomycetes bacterium]|nr:DUF6259 domain-containing protein [Planctomycetota bacterium]
MVADSLHIRAIPTGRWLRSLALAALAAWSSAVDATADGYRLELWRAGAATASVVVDGDADQDHPAAQVRLRRSAAAGDRRWELEVQPAPGFGVRWVEFPRLAVDLPADGGGARLVVPRQSGLALGDLAARPLREALQPHYAGSHLWHGTYGTNNQSLQCVMLELGGRTRMLWTPDPGMQIKDFVVDRETGTAALRLVLAVRHHPAAGGAVGTAWRSPYPVLLSTVDGTWQAAAERYRAWAWSQPWCAGGGLAARVRAGDLPAWYLRSPYWAVAIDHGNLPMLRALRALLPAAEPAVFLTQWQRNAFDQRLPEFFPPRNEAGHRRMNEAQTGGFHLFPYINCQNTDWLVDWAAEPGMAFLAGALAVPESPSPLSASIADRHPHVPGYYAYWGIDLARTDAVRARLRAAWSGPRDEALVRRLLGPGFPDYRYRIDGVAERLLGGWGVDIKAIEAVVARRPFRPVCRAHPHWVDYLTGLATASAAYGSHGLYLDETTIPTLNACWAADHGHPPGLGAVPIAATRAMIAAVRARCPQLVLAGEAIGEWSVGSCEDLHALHPTLTAHPGQLPLFQQVYHGHIALMGSDMPDAAPAGEFAHLFHRQLHLGFKPGFARVESYLRLADPRCDAGVRQAFVNAVAELGAHMEDVTLGQRLADPVWQAAPVVGASAWRALAGGPAALLLTNASAGPQPIRLAGLPAGTRLVRTDAAADPAAGMTLAPWACEVWRIEP